MFRLIIFCFHLIILTQGSFAQEAVIVTDQTFKVGAKKEETLYFGFAKGDRIIFSFLETGGKEMKEVEVVQYPENVTFTDYQTSKIDGKTITVTQKGIYIFRFKNSALSGRVCKVSIQRVPENEGTRNFSTAVAWQEKQETTYNTFTKDAVVGYDTTYVEKTRKEPVKTELSEDRIMEKTERVHSTRNFENKNFTTIHVKFPADEISAYKSKKMIAWAYWLGVGKEAQEVWAKNLAMVTTVAQGASKLLGGGPLGSIAIGAVSKLAMPTVGEDVKYCFLPDLNNAEKFKNKGIYKAFDEGKGVAAYGKNPPSKTRDFYIGLFNDNQVQAINVEVKISAIWETVYYQDKAYKEALITPRYGKKQFSEPVVRKVRVPVMSE